MKLGGHAAGGVLITRALFGVLRPNSNSERLGLLISGAVAGTLPDWDGILYVLNKKQFRIESDFRHHTWVTHTFIFHWILSGVLYWFGKVLKESSFKKKALVVGASTTMHLIQDMVGTGDGIMLFYPWSRKMHGVWLSGLHGSEWQADYVKRPVYNIERFIKAFALVIFVLEFFRRVGRKDG